MNKSPAHPGKVDWTGENPGIYLKEDPDGPWTGLMCFFRIVYSPHGLGHGVVVLDQPGVEQGLPQVRNFCICDNEPLARYLVANYFSSFASFRVSPGIKALSYLPATHVERGGDTRSRYWERVQSAQLDVRMTWEGLGAPYAVEMPAERGPTKKHDMYSVFLDAADASVTVNGQPLRGRVATRDFAGEPRSSAFLAFAESWLEVGR